MKTNDEIGVLLEQLISEGNRRREDDIQWRGKFEGTVTTLTNEMGKLRERQDKMERELAVVGGKAREALDSNAALEGRAIGAVNALAANVSTRLTQQDGVIAAIKSETEKQTPMLTQAMTFIVGTQAQYRLIRNLLIYAPIVIGALVAIAHYAATAR